MIRRRLEMGLLFTLLTIGALGAPAPAQQSAGSDDPEFARLVKEWTTQPEFLSPLVDHLPVVSGIPSPKDVLGHHIGAPRKLTYYGDILSFYRTLASQSRRVKVLSIGMTDEGRECVVVFVGSEESIENLERYRELLGRLADPRQVGEAQAAEILATAKPIYHLMGGLHSSESGPPEMLMELSYRLAVEDSPLIRQIRDNLIVSITPVAEPDGRDRFVDWYLRYNVDVTDEDRQVVGPPYWGKYVFHDNNRDINYSQVTMRNLLRWYLQWHPPIMHELHESVPFLYTFSGQAPQNPTLDPILFGELPWFANFEMTQMTKYGMPGVWTHAFVDMWSPGYLGFMSSNHNGMLRMYETFGNNGATTMKRKTERADEAGSSRFSATSREWYRPLPPYKEVEWSMRNNTNYMQTGVLSALQLASAFPKVILENFYNKSRNSIEAGRKDAPFGYILPAGQPDMTRVANIVRILKTQGIEVGLARSEFKLQEGTFPAGSYIVKRDQPYGRLAKILLEKQVFPDSSLRTYDDTGWTMGLLSHADVREITDRAVLEVAVTPVVEVTAPGAVTGGRSPSGGSYLVAHRGSNHMITLRYRLRDLAVRAIERPFKSGGAELPAGSFLIAADQDGRDLRDRIRTAVLELGLSAVSVSGTPDVPAHDVDLPRLAVYSTWGDTQNVGWVRYALDRFEVGYDLIFKDRIRQGALRDAYDIIVVPDQYESGTRLVFDIEPQERPIPYARTETFRTLGMYGESADITRGMGLEGAAEIQRFVEAGGVLATLGGASYYPPEFGLTRRIEANRPSRDFYAPGPIVEAEILHPDHPVFYGYSKAVVPVRYAGGPLLRVEERDRPDQVLMKFPGTDGSVLSGLMKGVAEIRNRPAIVDVPSGKGRVVMFATNPAYRWQTFGELNMLFNLVLHFNDARGRQRAGLPTANP